jgi:hypothetical protein
MSTLSRSGLWCDTCPLTAPRFAEIGWQLAKWIGWPGKLKQIEAIIGDTIHVKVPLVWLVSAHQWTQNLAKSIGLIYLHLTPPDIQIQCTPEANPSTKNLARNWCGSATDVIGWKVVSFPQSCNSWVAEIVYLTKAASLGSLDCSCCPRIFFITLFLADDSMWAYFSHPGLCLHIRTQSCWKKDW